MLLAWFQWMRVQSLAQLLHGAAASASVLHGQAGAWGALDGHQPLVPARALDGSPQGHEQVHVPDMTPSRPCDEWSPCLSGSSPYVPLR